MAPKVSKVAKVQVSSDSESSGSESVKHRCSNAVSLKMAKEVKEFMGDSASDLSQDKIHKVCNALIKVIVDQVKSGKTVTLTNNMSFKRVLRNERVHRNPKTHESVTKPAHFVLKMEVKQALKTQFEELDINEEVEEEAVKVDKAKAKPTKAAKNRAR